MEDFQKLLRCIKLYPEERQVTYKILADLCEDLGDIESSRFIRTGTKTKYYITLSNEPVNFYHIHIPKEVTYLEITGLNITFMQFSFKDLYKIKEFIYLYDIERMSLTSKSFKNIYHKDVNSKIYSKLLQYTSKTVTPELIHKHYNEYEIAGKDLSYAINSYVEDLYAIT